MLCESCKKREARVHYTGVINGVVEEHHLCEICAAGIQDTMGGKFPLHKLFDSLNVDLVCPTCGLTYEKFKSTGKLGCPECYNAFGDELKGVIKGIHGHTQHRGKMPKRGFPKLKLIKDIDELTNRLEDAVSKEEYEKAAVLRDEIKRIREELEINPRGDSND
ncbi:MAG: UvrB/UvrC motif-containing protein [Gudongella sp.]|jgi:protein arginine kinase activator|nr:UvrB/UvrC motif-containing protein [Gudongella sp.]